MIYETCQVWCVLAPYEELAGFQRYIWRKVSSNWLLWLPDMIYKTCQVCWYVAHYSLGNVTGAFLLGQSLSPTRLTLP